MKSRIVFWTIICALVAIGSWLAWPRKSIPMVQRNSVVEQSATNSIVETAITNPASQNRPPERAQPNASQTNEPLSRDEMLKQAQSNAFAKMQEGSWEWKVPINFYGRVVDESNVPVAGATASFEWNDLSPTGTSKDSTTSDDNGLFSLKDRHGKRLYVNVGKEGYYSSGNSRASAFEYANPYDGLFTPDAGNPIVFHLRKKGTGVDLITSQYGMRPDFPIHIARDGTPVNVDVMQRKSGDTGQMQITENKPEFSNWKQATNWWFRIEIPDGGFVGENDEFPFEAPESGYQPIVEFNFQQGNPDWTTDINTNFYIEFGNPPLYGRLQVQTGISYGGATLTYAINPTGSRNLEPK